MYDRADVDFLPRFQYIPAGGVVRMNRRLAAILAADVKSYRRMIGEDKVGAYQTLTKNLESLRNIISDHDGRIYEFNFENREGAIMKNRNRFFVLFFAVSGNMLGVRCHCPGTRRRRSSGKSTESHRVDV